jgi:hypothetical protein
MKEESKNIHSIKKTARIAGLLYFLQIPLGVFGLVYVPKALIVSGDAAATAHNILANEFLFRLSMVSAILTAILTVITAYYLYKLLKSVNKTAALIMVIFTLVVAPISIINELNNVAILLLLQGQGAFTTVQVHTLMSLFFDLHKYGIQIAGIFFGLWLLPMGYLVIKSKFIPKIIGILLIIGCFSYLIDFFTFFLFPNFGVVTTEYTFLGEVFMVLWLLIKGVDAKQWEKHALKPVN